MSAGIICLSMPREPRIPLIISYRARPHAAESQDAGSQKATEHRDPSEVRGEETHGFDFLKEQCEGDR